MLKKPTIDAFPLHLRVPTPDDEDEWKAITSLSDIVKLGLSNLSHELKLWEEHDYGLFIIIHSKSSEALGIAGVAASYRCNGPHLVAAMSTEARGQIESGSNTLANVACRAVVDWWQETKDVPLFAHVELDNKKGQCLAQAIGGQLLPYDSDLRLPTFYSTTQFDYVLR